jgi:hypothetical protein
VAKRRLRHLFFRLYLRQPGFVRSANYAAAAFASALRANALHIRLRLMIGLPRRSARKAEAKAGGGAVGREPVSGGARR